MLDTSVVARQELKIIGAQFCFGGSRHVISDIVLNK